MSIHTCVMTVKGDGKGGYGKFKSDVTRTVENFIVDNQHLYGKVRRHVKECQDADPCDPLDVVKVHLSRVNCPKRNGIVSESLLNNILSYKRKYGDRIPDEVVIDAATRARSLYVFNSREQYLKTGEDVLRMFTFVYENSLLLGFAVLARPPQFKGRWAGLMGYLVRIGLDSYPNPLPSREELLKMVAVMEVMSS